MAGLKRYSIERYKTIWAWAFLAIPILFYASIRFYPTLEAFFISFTSWNIVSLKKPFIGLENYWRLFLDPVFWKTFGNTLKYGAFGLPLSLLLSFAVAYLLNDVRRWVGFFRALYFIPYLTSMVAVSWVWRWLYQQAPIGLFNSILVALKLPQQGFLMSQRQALFAVLAPTIWAGLGFPFIIFLAGLKSISPYYYEAAEIDGAGAWVKLRRITLPLLKSTIIFLVVTGTISYLRIFTQVLNMTYQGEGGPLNSTKPIVLYMYNQAFQSFAMGYAATISVVLFVVILAITVIQLRVMRESEHGE